MVAAELTDAGKQSLICRIEDDPEKSANHWEVLPYLANYQDPGTPKPGAVVLAADECRGQSTAVAGYGKLWPRPHGCVCYGGKLAMANAAAGR